MLKQNLGKTTLGRKLKEMRWRWVTNFKPTIDYLVERNRLTVEQKRINKLLNRDGIAISSVEGLFEDGELFDELAQAVAAEEERQKDAIFDRRTNQIKEIKSKTYTIELLGEKPTFNPDSIYARFSLHPSIVSVAETYFRMKVRLRWFNVWRTFISTSEPYRSQYWHIDKDDYHMITFFVYLSDISEGSGALSYAKGSHPKGRFKFSSPECFVEPGHDTQRSTDEQLSRVVPAENWIQALGCRGTIVIADNQGYHKGGYAKANERLLFAFYFNSPASLRGDKFK